MAGNTFGEIFKITTFGESHGEAIGVIVDGCPPNIEFDLDKIQSMMDRRKPGQNIGTSTTRKEEDLVHALSGIFQGKTTGTPIMMMIRNKDHRSSSYDDIKDLFRPGHGDFTYNAKYRIRDWRGGGRSSGRETAARVAAGGLAKLVLDKYKIDIFSHTKELGSISANKFEKKEINENLFLMADNEAASKVEEVVNETRKKGDSLGGIVEIILKNIPAGLGEPVFDKIDADLAKAMMSIGAVKGVEIGAGFEAVRMKGSENNDELAPNGFLSNNSGGILSGITNGEDIIIRIGVKPIPSISMEQDTIDVHGNKRKIKVKGRHDISAIPRINVVAEAMASLVVLDHILRAEALDNGRFGV